MNSKIRLGGLVAAIAIFAAACGGGATPSPSESAAPSAAPESPAASTGPSGEVLEGSLTLWNAYASGGEAEGNAFNEILASAAEQFPNLEITSLDVPFSDLYTKFETEAATGGGPDLYIAPNDNLGNEVRANLLVDVTSAFEASENAGNTLDVAKFGSQVDGKYYMVPESLKAVAMFYDKSVVTAPPTTTDELLSAVQGGLAFGINQNPYHNWGFYSAFGGQIMDDSGRCVADQGGVADAFQFLADLKAAGAQFYTDGAKFQDDFKTGKLAAIIEGPWFSGDAVGALGDNLGVAPIPAGPGGSAAPMTGVDGWYINASSPNAELATKFAIWATNQANQQIYVDVAGHIPADSRISIADPIVAGFADAVKSGDPRPQIPELNNYWGNFGDALNKVLDAGADPTTAVADACAAMNTANNFN